MHGVTTGPAIAAERAKAALGSVGSDRAGRDRDCATGDEQAASLTNARSAGDSARGSVSADAGPSAITAPSARSAAAAVTTIHSVVRGATGPPTVSAGTASTARATGTAEEGDSSKAADAAVAWPPALSQVRFDESVSERQRTAVTSTSARAWFSLKVSPASESVPPNT